jgi:hypothetical protein
MQTNPGVYLNTYWMFKFKNFLRRPFTFAAF